ncbi:Alpha/Beta hydrolase protein [Polychytrium aggregatum]|uniref:Alpha/Beta hydrolase protein n=1 Tax=Polychytrium aggregatum TaxID=110093 RepID=UPI0022FEAB03|nr:Alpha/Beta hydrolase protein [Polychytrium aggregatum]KAI9204785.1 Alpha/Beta hydrolase protein [Polychytrium aggregatum]
MHWTLKLGLALGPMLAVSLISALYLYQAELIYPSSIPPGSRTQVALPHECEMSDYDEEMITTPDKVKLHVYAIYKRKGAAGFDIINDPVSRDGMRSRKPGSGSVADYTVLYFHANAGNMGHRLPISYLFYRCLNCNVVMLSYRGYGKSEGHASEAGLKIDSYTALDYIKNHPLLKHTKVILFGQSIGGAVAINLAAERSADIHGLIVENTFLSLPKLIPHVMPMIRNLVFLCHQVWNSEESIRRISPSVPILFLSGSKDELVPQTHMRRLYEIASSQRADEQAQEEKLDLKSRRARVDWHEFRDGTHNDTCIQSGYIERVVQFWDEQII